MANSERLVRGKRRCALLMHPDDAASRDIVDGSWVRVTSRVGTIEVEVELTTTVMIGVVCLPHGWGHNRDGVQLRVARAHGGASVNDLTDEQRVDVVSGNAVFSGTMVHVVCMGVLASRPSS
jgi:anaerobic selenocysteine-containing dehydrogenase